MPRHIIKTASAKMPASCWGRYARVAVIELSEGYDDAPKITEHSRAVKRIVQLWDKLHVGKTQRCAFQKAFAEAEALRDKLNQC